MLVDIHYNGNDCVKCIVDLVGLSKLVLNKDTQVLPVLDQLVIVT